MKRGILVLPLLLLALGAQGVVYHLEKVNAISDKAQYVLVRRSKALTTIINEGKLQATDTYQTSDLTGTEGYIWTIYQSGNYHVLTNGSQRLIRKSNTNNLDWSTTSEAGIRWTISFQGDSSASLKVDDDPYYPNYYLANTDTFYTKYNIRYEEARRFYIFQLVPMTYDRSATVDKLSTVCLPYAVDKVTGADVYQISYLEKDKAGNPYKLYYEEVTGELEAGRPYLFVPKEATVRFQKKDANIVAAPTYKDDGFYGTFSAIQDGVAGTSGNVLEGKYVVYNNAFQKCGGSCSLSANRAYIDMEKVPTTQPQSGVQGRMLVLSPTGVEYITKIDEIANEQKVEGCQKRIEEGKLVIIRNGKRYNVQGGRL